MCMDVESPGPSDGGMLNDNYVFTTTNESIHNQQGIEVSFVLFQLLLDLFDYRSSSSVCMDSSVKEIKMDISNFDGSHAVKENIQFYSLAAGENSVKNKCCELMRLLLDLN